MHVWSSSQAAWFTRKFLHYDLEMSASDKFKAWCASALVLFVLVAGLHGVRSAKAVIARRAQITLAQRSI